MAKGREPLRIPQTWKDQARAFVIQLEKILDTIFHRADDNEKRIEEVDESKLSLTGGTMTGNIEYNHPTIDASKANNNVSSGTTWFSTLRLRDKAGRMIASCVAGARADGRVAVTLYLKNYDTDGNQVAEKGLYMNMDKSGTLTWDVSEKANFRKAIEGAHMGSVAILADGDSHIAISSGDYVYVINNTHSLSDGLYKASTAIAANASVSSSNMTAIDYGGLNEINGQLLYKNIGTFTTEAGLVTALDSEMATMGTYSQKAIRFNFSSANGEFGARYYYGTLTKAGSNSYGSMMVITTSSAVAQIINGSKNNPTWVFNNITENKVEGRKITIASNSSKTITLENSSRITLITSSAYSSHAGIINLYCSSTGTAGYHVIAGATGLTISSSGASITISTTYGINGTAIIHAGSVTIA